MNWLRVMALACCMAALLAADDSRWVWGNENRRAGRVGEFSDGRPVLALNSAGTYGLTPSGGPRPYGTPSIGPQPFPASFPGPARPAPVHELDDDDAPFYRPALRPPVPPVGGYRPFPPAGPYSDGGFQGGGILPGGVRPGYGRPPFGGGPNGGGPIGGGPIGGGSFGGPPNPAAVGGLPPPGIGGPPLGPNGAPVPPYENPILKDPPPHTGGYDTCKCALSFNCNSPGIKFGVCDVGKQYCCYNSHIAGSNRRPSNLNLGPRPGEGPGVLIGPGGPYDVPPPPHGGPGPFTPYAANKKALALKNKL